MWFYQKKIMWSFSKMREAIFQKKKREEIVLKEQ